MNGALLGLNCRFSFNRFRHLCGDSPTICSSKARAVSRTFGLGSPSWRIRPGVAFASAAGTICPSASTALVRRVAWQLFIDDDPDKDRDAPGVLLATYRHHGQSGVVANEGVVVTQLSFENRQGGHRPGGRPTECSRSRPVARRIRHGRATPRAWSRPGVGPAHHLIQDVEYRAAVGNRVRVGEQSQERLDGRTMPAPFEL